MKPLFPYMISLVFYTVIVLFIIVMVKNLIFKKVEDSTEASHEVYKSICCRSGKYLLILLFRVIFWFSLMLILVRHFANSFDNIIEFEMSAFEGALNLFSGFVAGCLFLIASYHALKLVFINQKEAIENINEFESGNKKEKSTILMGL